MPAPCASSGPFCRLASGLILLASVVTTILTSTDDDSLNIQTLYNTIHNKETLRYYVDLMFPTLTKDVRITYDNPEHQKLQPLEVKPPAEELFSVSFYKGIYSNCSFFDSIDYYTFLMVCNQDTTLHIMGINFEDESLFEISRFEMQKNETIVRVVTTSSGLSKNSVYGAILVNLRKNQEETQNNMAVVIFKSPLRQKGPTVVIDRTNFKYNLTNMLSFVDLDDIKIRFSRCPNDSVVGIFACREHQERHLFLFPSYKVRPRNKDSMNQPEVLMFDVFDDGSDDTIKIRMGGVFSRTPSNSTDDSVPWFPVNWEFNQRTSWYMSPITHPRGLWFLHNVLANDKAAFKLISCTIDRRSGQADPDEPERSINCEPVESAVELGALCRNSELELMNFDSNYWTGSDVASEFKNFNFYLITNCRMVTVSFDKLTVRPTAKPTDVRLPYIVQSSTSIDKSEGFVYGFLKSSDVVDKSYLFSLNEKLQSIRLYQNLNFSSKDYMFMFDDSMIESQVVMGYDWDARKNSSKFTFITIIQEQIITNPKKIANISKGIILAKVSGECAGSVEMSYLIKLDIVDSFDVVRGNDAFGDYWFHTEAGASNELITTELPFDARKILGNDYEISSSTPDIVKIERSRPNVTYSNSSVLLFEKDTSGQRTYYSAATLRNLPNVTYVQLYREFVVVEYPGEFAIFRCGVKLEPSDPDGLICVELVKKAPKALSLANVSVSSLSGVKNRNGTYFFSLIWLYENQFHITRIRTDFPEDDIVSRYYTLRYAVKKAEIVYTQLGLTLIGVGPLVNNSNIMVVVTSVVDTATSQNSSLRFYWKKLVSNDIKDPSIKNFTSFGDSKYGVIIEEETYYYAIYFMLAEDSINPMIEEPDVISKRSYDIIKMTSTRVIVQNLINLIPHSYGFLTYLPQKIGQYVGELPLPFGPGHDLLYVQDNQGILVFIFNQKQNNLDPGVIVVYVLDLRFFTDTPLDRLLVSRRLLTTLDQILVENAKVLYLIDPASYNLHILGFFTNGTSSLTSTLYSARHTLTFRPSDLKSRVNQLELTMKSGLTESKSTKATIRLVATEFDSTLTAIPRQSKLKIEEKPSGNFAADIDTLIAYSGHVRKISLLVDKSQGKVLPGFVRFTPMLQKFNFSLCRSFNESFKIAQPTSHRPKHADFNKTFASAEDTYRVVFSQSMLIAGKRNFSVWRAAEDDSMYAVLDVQNLPSQLVSAFINYESRLFYKINNKGPIVFVLALIRGEFLFNDLIVYVVDLQNTSNVQTETVKNFCQCDKVRFEVLSRLEATETYNLAVYYRQISFNGTTWVSSLVQITRKFPDHPDSILAGMVVSYPMLQYPLTFKLKPIEVTSYGVLKPTASTTMMYFFFENSGEIGLYYRGSKPTNLFSYHQFSKSCLVVNEKSVSCKIFESELDISCMVKCDDTRIENFRIRVHVDIIEAGSQEKLSGVELITNKVVYKLPADYKAVQMIKGETLDYVVVRVQGELRMIMYDAKTGYISYEMDEEELCSDLVDPSYRSKCSFSDTFVYQMTNSRIMIVPKYKPLVKSVYTKKNPQLIFDTSQMDKKPSGKPYSVEILGLKSKQTIRLDYIVEVGDTTDMVIWVFLGGTVAFILAGICILVVYQNWRADEDMAKKLKQTYSAIENHPQESGNFSVTSHSALNRGRANRSRMTGLPNRNSTRFSTSRGAQTEKQ